MTNPIYGKEMWAWVFDDPMGKDGIPSQLMDFGLPTQAWQPLITSREHLAKGPMREAAEEMAKARGLRIELLHYKLDGVVEAIDP